MQDPPKFTQTGILGLKICHLATLPGSEFSGRHLEFSAPKLGDETDEAETDRESRQGQRHQLQDAGGHVVRRRLKVRYNVAKANPEWKVSEGQNAEC
jgi:hypothetical protein